MVVFVLWMSSLIALALLTANPITLNVAQVTAAPLVIEATRNPGQAEWQVSRSWPAGRTAENIRIQGLEQLPIDAGRAYLIPVAPAGAGEYRVVISPKPFATPFIYPADRETVADLEAILRKREAE
ncbi:MAG: hypothetical protein AB7U20_18050 [Planctomycetaceae bacterium]